MSLGWALRGFIGGGPLGAMIPGAMIGLVLCRLLGRERDAGLIAAFAAVGVGFGGEETYGQTVGLSFLPETYWWAVVGFAIKGGAWGLLGGAMIGTAFTRERYRKWDIPAGLGLLIAGTWLGWKLINQPKLIYFSNRLDRPRAEIWAGLIAGGVLFLTWLTVRGGARIPWRFALSGALGGGLGFASGAAIQVWGRPTVPVFPLGWWKVMELTFGALLGLTFGWCAWRNREELIKAAGPPSAVPSHRCAIYMAATAIGFGLCLAPAFHTRFDYVIVGAILLALALRSRTLCWQIAITLTVCAFAYDLLEGKPKLPQAPLWMFVVGVTLATIVITVRAPRIVPIFLWLTWTAVATSLLKSFVPLVSGDPIMMESLFVIMALAVSWLCWKDPAAARVS
jgi:hypothetical protein